MSMPYNDKKICITAGHGGKDSGAVAFNRTESTICTDARNICKFYINRAGVICYTDGDGNENKPLADVVKMMKSMPDNALKVEFHCNAAASSQAQGVEALSLKANKALAQELAQAVSKIMGIPVRGDKGWKPQDAGQHRKLAVCEAGGIVLELFFISNPLELKIWDETKWLVMREVAGVLVKRARGMK